MDGQRPGEAVPPGTVERAPAGPVPGVEEAQLAAVVRDLRAQVADQLAGHHRRHEQATGTRLSDTDRAALIGQLIAEALDAHAAAVMAAGRPPLPPQVESRIRREIRDGLLGAAGLQPLLDDPSVEDIVANGCDQVWVRHTDGRWMKAEPVAASDGELVEVIRTLAARCGIDERRWDRAAPVLDVQLPDGGRLNAVMAVTRRPSLSIRRHHYEEISTLDELVARGTLDVGLAQMLAAAVRARLNIMIAGRAGAGKTTLLRVLARIPRDERLVTLEDSYELALDRDPAVNVMALQAREANVEGEGEISMARLFRASLRMVPDRVVVGEVRGGEVVVMLNAMSHGDGGSLSTIHARSSANVFSKIALYAGQAERPIGEEATARLIAESIHLVVHLAKLDDHQRAVTSIREVVGADGIQVSSNEIYRPGPAGRAVPGAPMSTELAQTLEGHGLDLRLLRNPAGWWQPQPQRHPGQQGNTGRGHG